MASANPRIFGNLGLRQQNAHTEPLALTALRIHQAILAQ
jgi:hypothetical protein